MPANTPVGIPYPLSTDPVSDGATAMQNMANWLDGRVRIAAGQVTIPVANAVQGSAAISFPAGRFTSAAQIMLAALPNTPAYNLSFAALTTSGATLNARHVDNAVNTLNVVARWIAIQTWPGGG